MTNGAVEHLPEKLFDQLIDGGRLVAVIKKVMINWEKPKFIIN